jgi:DNA-binding NarL/FixJ family response regulator
LPFFTDEDNKRGRIALPCENASRDKVKLILVTTLSLQERSSNEEVTEEIILSIFRQMTHIASTSVAQHLGASRGSIHRLARKEGVELQDNGPKLTPAQQEEALDMVRAGASLRQVAERFGINHESVRRMVMRKQRELEE